MENLWTKSGNAVEAWTRKIICAVCRAPNAADQLRCRAFSRDASLAATHRSCDILRRVLTGQSAPSRPPNVNVHRYEEHIAGRTYLHRSLCRHATRWRAQIARLPGMPTALMPFYGPTPEEAARELSRWLALVYNGTPNNENTAVLALSPSFDGRRRPRSLAATTPCPLHRDRRHDFQSRRAAA